MPPKKTSASRGTQKKHLRKAKERESEQQKQSQVQPEKKSNEKKYAPIKKNAPSRDVDPVDLYLNKGHGFPPDAVIALRSMGKRDEKTVQKALAAYRQWAAAAIEEYYTDINLHYALGEQVLQSLQVFIFYLQKLLLNPSDVVRKETLETLTQFLQPFTGNADALEGEEPVEVRLAGLIESESHDIAPLMYLTQDDLSRAVAFDARALTQKLGLKPDVSAACDLVGGILQAYAEQQDHALLRVYEDPDPIIAQALIHVSRLVSEFRRADAGGDLVHLLSQHYVWLTLSGRHKRLVRSAALSLVQVCTHTRMFDVPEIFDVAVPDIMRHVWSDENLVLGIYDMLRTYNGAWQASIHAEQENKRLQAEATERRRQEELAGMSKRALRKREKEFKDAEQPQPKEAMPQEPENALPKVFDHLLHQLRHPWLQIECPYIPIILYLRTIPAGVFPQDKLPLIFDSMWACIDKDRLVSKNKRLTVERYRSFTLSYLETIRYLVFGIKVTSLDVDGILLQFWRVFVGGAPDNYLRQSSTCQEIATVLKKIHDTRDDKGDALFKEMAAVASQDPQDSFKSLTMLIPHLAPFGDVATPYLNPIVRDVLASREPSSTLALEQLDLTEQLIVKSGKQNTAHLDAYAELIDTHLHDLLLQGFSTGHERAIWRHVRFFLSLDLPNKGRAVQTIQSVCADDLGVLHFLVKNPLDDVPVSESLLQTPVFETAVRDPEPVQRDTIVDVALAVPDNSYFLSLIEDALPVKLATFQQGASSAFFSMVIHYIARAHASPHTSLEFSSAEFLKYVFVLAYVLPFAADGLYGAQLDAVKSYFLSATEGTNRIASIAPFLLSILVGTDATGSSRDYVWTHSIEPRFVTHMLTTTFPIGTNIDELCPVATLSSWLHWATSTIEVPACTAVVDSLHVPDFLVDHPGPSPSIPIDPSYVVVPDSWDHLPLTPSDVPGTALVESDADAYTPFFRLLLLVVDIASTRSAWLLSDTVLLFLLTASQILAYEAHLPRGATTGALYSNVDARDSAYVAFLADVCHDLVKRALSRLTFDISWHQAAVKAGTPAPQDTVAPQALALVHHLALAQDLFAARSLNTVLTVIFAYEDNPVPAAECWVRPSPFKQHFAATAAAAQVLKGSTLLGRFRNSLCMDIRDATKKNDANAVVTLLRLLLVTMEDTFPHQQASSVLGALRTWAEDTSYEFEDEAAFLYIARFISQCGPALVELDSDTTDFILDFVDTCLARVAYDESTSYPLFAAILDVLLVTRGLAADHTVFRSTIASGSAMAVGSLLALLHSSLRLTEDAPVFLSAPFSRIVSQTNDILETLELKTITAALSKSPSEILEWVAPGVVHANALVANMCFSIAELCIPEIVSEEAVKVALSDAPTSSVVALPQSLTRLITHPTDEGLLVWLLLLGFFERAPPAVKFDYLSQLKQTDALQNALFPRLVPALSHAISGFSLYNIVDLSTNALLRFGHLATSLVYAHVYYKVLQTIPVTVRLWLEKNRDRTQNQKVIDLTVSHFSPIIIQQELRIVRENVANGDPDLDEDDAENFEIKVSRNSFSNNDVRLVYEIDEYSMEVVFSIPKAYPIEPVSIRAQRKVGASEQQWRSWILSSQQILSSLGGSITDAVFALRRNMAAHFRGVEPCAICYCAISPTDKSLPGRSCPTCHNPFHAGCLYQWFSSSGNATCPLCRSTF